MRPKYKLPKYEVVGPRGCWVVIGQSRCAGGYVRINRNGRLHQAHRWVYEKLVGPIPEGLDLDHICRNRPCINPDHLEPVTEAENKRRAPSTKATAADVFKMRSMSVKEAHRYGKSIGLAKSTVSGIIHGKHWAGIEPEAA